MYIVYAAAFAMLISLGDANAGLRPVRKCTSMLVGSKTYYKWYAPGKGVQWTVKLKHPRMMPGPFC